MIKKIISKSLNGETMVVEIYFLSLRIYQKIVKYDAKSF